METKINLDAMRRDYLDVGDEAVFLERARIVRDSGQKYGNLSPGLRQGRTIEDLCDQITIVVGPHDILLGRILEEIPSPPDQSFIDRHPEFFMAPGVPGWLDSASIYIPDWAKLLRVGISGLIEETEQCRRRLGQDEDSRARENYLNGVGRSLRAISRLISRYALAAEQQAGQAPDAETRARLLAAAESSRRICSHPPEGFREALQLFVFFHLVLSCLIGGRNVTPGRMDQYLFPFYDRDLASGRIGREEVPVLLAATMIILCQTSGNIATDFQSSKRTPNRYSHYYVTLAGDGAVNSLSFAFLEAMPLVNHREPSFAIRYTRDIDRDFWNQVLALMRDRRPVFAYNDDVVIPALVCSGVPEMQARDYAHGGCMNCLIPGQSLSCLRNNHNFARYLLLAINGGRDPLSGKQAGPATPGPDALQSFDDVFGLLRRQVRASLQRTWRSYNGISRRLPLPVWPLFDGHLEAGYHYWEHRPKYADQHLTGLATTVDSLLAIRRAVYREKMLSLREFTEILRANFSGQVRLRQYLQERVPSYGSDHAEVLQMSEEVGKLWVEEVTRVSSRAHGVRLRPGFHSWLFHLQMGEQTGATPDGRQRGEPLSADLLPSVGRARPPTEMLRCMARIPHHHTCSGGTILHLHRSHFSGRHGIRLLSSLIETYFASGGLQLHFVFADRRELQDAIENPEKHRDLLVRVTGFSEYFVRLLPAVQRELARREPVS